MAQVHFDVGVPRDEAWGCLGASSSAHNDDGPDILCMSCCRLNAAEMYVDVEAVKGGDKAVQWISESGILDLFILTGPTPAAVTQQFASLSGTTAMPQLFALGYHQCRCDL